MNVRCYLMLTLALIVLFAMSTPICAQVVEEWIAVYNNMAVNEEDVATDVAVDDLGNVYVTGYSANNPIAPFDYDYRTIKYDANGVQLWVSTFGGVAGGDDFAQAIAVDQAGNVYVTGHFYAIATASYDFATVKYDPFGVQIWAAFFTGPGPGDDVATDITVDAAGTYVYVTGYCIGAGTFEDYTTIKYDAVLGPPATWIQTYDHANDIDMAYAIDVDPGGYVYVTGMSIDPVTHEDYLTLRYSPGGLLLWAARYDATANLDVATALFVSDASDVYVTGKSYGGMGFGDDIVTIKYDPFGVQLWIPAPRWDNVGLDDGGNDIAIDLAGDVYVTGYTDTGTGATYFDYATIKYDVAGTILWTTTYDGPVSMDDEAQAIEVDDYGNAYVTGWSTGNWGFDYATLKYSTNGTQMWEMRYNGTSMDNDQAVALALTNEGKAVVTGWSNGAGTNFDYVTIQYTPRVMVWLTPYGAPIIIPSGGGSFTFNIALQNFDSTPTNFDVWCDATIPGGTIVGPLIGPVNLTRPAGWSGNIDRTQTVPAPAPSGTYSYNAYVGVFPGTVWDKDHFLFDKSHHDGGAAIGDWFNYGDSFEGVSTPGYESKLPAAHSLGDNYPNPFNPVTTLSFALPEASQVYLTVFDLQGRIVAELVNGMREAGVHEVTFDASHLASGLYFYRLEAGEFTSVKKMILMK